VWLLVVFGIFVYANILRKRLPPDQRKRGVYRLEFGGWGVLLVGAWLGVRIALNAVPATTRLIHPSMESVPLAVIDVFVLILQNERLKNLGFSGLWLLVGLCCSVFVLVFSGLFHQEVDTKQTWRLAMSFGVIPLFAYWGLLSFGPADLWKTRKFDRTGVIGGLFICIIWIGRVVYEASCEIRLHAPLSAGRYADHTSAMPNGGRVFPPQQNTEKGNASAGRELRADR
jgi:hypothetical protein